MVDPLSPVFRDGLPGAFAESPLTKQDRELQCVEGRPPLEVTHTDAQVLRRRRKPEPDARWRQSNGDREQSERDCSDAEQEKESVSCSNTAEKAPAEHRHAWDAAAQGEDENNEEGSSGLLLDRRT